MKNEKFFHIKILGRMLEHLGVQMYKKRNTAIAELVANAWDANATEVRIQIPAEAGYLAVESIIVIEDNGSGMDEDSVQHKYMVVGRNRRKDEEVNAETDPNRELPRVNTDKSVKVKGRKAIIPAMPTNQTVEQSRKVMGRKGIGKLAGFGIASDMKVQTWRKNSCTEFSMNIKDLKIDDNEAKDIPIRYKVFKEPPQEAKTNSGHGTRIVLSHLKHKSPIETASLKESLARRFSRTVRGQMTIYVNGSPIGEPDLTYKYKFPEAADKNFEQASLADGNKVIYEWALADKPIKQPEMRGFTILVRGKTAQAPNFFFDVEGTATGQHGTKYLVGTIEADYLDEGTDDEPDYISTDRQEIDWEADEMKPLYEWGQRLVKNALLKNNELAADKFEKDVLAHEDLRERIERLGKEAEKQVIQVLRTLGKAEPDPERTRDLADALVRAYEYRHFHKSVEEIKNIEDPEMLLKLLMHLHDWQVIESLAILEIIKGRLAIVEKFHQMIVNDVPETANRNIGDNMHDLIAGYPWLLNPEWQVLDEEKTISKQLKEWHHEDIQDADKRMRYDFIALTDERRLAVVEIKRVGHALEIDDLHQVDKYKNRLESATEKKDVMNVVVYGGNANMSDATISSWKARPDTVLLTWGGIYERTKAYYQHYKAVLEGDINDPNFFRKGREVNETRSMLRSGKIYRSPEIREEGLGSQDTNLESLDNG